MRQRVVVLLALAACFDETPQGTGIAGTSYVESFELPGTITNQLDVLFVVDNRPAMASHQAKLGELAAALDTVLTSDEGSVPDSRVAVTTFDAAGALRQSTATSDPFLAVGLDARYEHTSNFTGTFTSALGELLAAGTAGAAATPLGAMKAALDSNPGFMREHAGLAVITISTTDDASSESVNAYVAAHKARAEDPTRLVVNGVQPAGATKLGAFLSMFPNRSSVTDLAASDWTGAVTLLESLQRQHLGLPCVARASDVDLDQPGDQWDCSIEAVYSDGTTEVLPRCVDGDPARCYDLVEDSLCGQGGDDYALFVVNGFPGRHRPGIRGQCVVIH